MRRIIPAFFLCLSFFSPGCQDNGPAEKQLPANLTLTFTVSTDGSGVVVFIAKADNASRFQFFFGETGEVGWEVPAATADGKVYHAYLNSGTYNVKVLAFSADELSIDKTASITIEVDEPPITTAGYTSPTTYAGLTLVWNDEFDGDDLNPDYWTHETGNGTDGWGNNELQFYQADNTLVQDGYLTIKAKAENVGGRNYTSSRIITKDKKAFTYGRVDIRALMPKGQGIWPALWMLGSNISEPEYIWPKCGEIDIMEMVGGGAGKDDKVYGTVHWDNAGSYASYGGDSTLTNGKILADEFHVYSIVWTETLITWYLDNVQYHVIDITPPELNEFQKEFFFLFNVAVGGNWPGSPDSNTVFPQRMIVDYIRVFQVQ